MQRVLVREAIGKLRAAEELFGAEDNRSGSTHADYEAFRERVNDFQAWVFEESSIA